MLFGKPIEKGFVSRWSWATLDLFERMTFGRHLLALAIIFGLTFLMPGWPMLTQISAYLGIAIILGIVLYDKPSDTLSFIYHALPAVVGLSVISAFFSSGMHFLFSQMNFDDAFWQSFDWLAAKTNIQVMSLNMLFNQDLPQTMSQSPAMAPLIYLAGRKGPVPKMGIEYLITFSSVFNAVLQSMAATLLIMIMGEFIIRTSHIVLAAMAGQGSVNDVVLMVAYTIVVWFVLIPVSFYTKELIDGPVEVKRRKRAEIKQLTVAQEG